jgi:hypothetical protein
LNGGGYELRDAVAARDLERLIAQIGEDHLHLAAIIRVYVTPEGEAEHWRVGERFTHDLRVNRSDPGAGCSG